MKPAAVLALAAVLAGCGGGAAGGTAARVPTVFAAASLSEVFERLAGKSPEARFNFAGSDELATQIREGARADVYAAASARYPDELHSEGLVERPRVFATNRLVIVVPADNPARIRTSADLRRSDVRLVIGAAGVPVGDYAREALDAATLANVVSEEKDVKGVLGKVRLGEADAGVVYATDAGAAGDAVRRVELTGSAPGRIRYPVAVVSATRNRDAAERFVALLLSDRGRKALREAGFGLP